ncbi:hypothetical protein BY996DRAFT_8422000 [Phakopsora pachyrhizi]|uniref:Uncharacterized protein n=1 Tax=Phakopsora pachyrhizi TaxID=170000 RepID=A0AAV0ANQ6_PHAPC|nr:hypothetical protein BY996DRAFT_8422000 [Phakopsora pachyrhizi]CAH7670616.1 hypothetical protein PPACK8108_LOCUS5350 [Phakopsora pachyrhizi]
MKAMIAYLEGKLDKIKLLEKDYYSSKLQKTITDYKSKLKHKEAQIVGLENQNSLITKEKDLNLKKSKDLEIQFDYLNKQLNDSK